LQETLCIGNKNSFSVSKIAEANMQNNPLDNIKIASPCGANWDEMFGDNRKRFCAECKLTVYNISGMSQREAEDLLINSEGRVCIRLFKRHDGTVLTENCPVGLAKVKQKVSRIATATFALVLTFVSGVFSFFSLVEISADAVKIIENIKPKPAKRIEPGVSFGGGLSNIPEIKAAILKSRDL
jgi:hypothetical protein